MDEAEAVPFGDLGAAKAFIAANGGHIVRFPQMPDDYIFPGRQALPPQ